MSREELAIAEKIADQNNLSLKGLDVMKVGDTVIVDYKQTVHGQAERHVFEGIGFRAVIDRASSPNPNVLFVNYNISLLEHKGERGLGQVYSVITSANGDQNLMRKLGQAQGQLMTPQELGEEVQQQSLNLEGKQQLVSRPMKIAGQLTGDQAGFVQGAISANQAAASSNRPDSPKAPSPLLHPGHT